MNISRRWLEGFLGRKLDAQDVANRLVMLGAGVDAIEPQHPGLDKIVVGLVESVSPHPNADRLRLWYSSHFRVASSSWPVIMQSRRELDIGSWYSSRMPWSRRPRPSGSPRSGCGRCRG